MIRPDKELKCVCIGNFPKAIIHVDMDSFFASVEQQRNPKYRNKPLCIGAERGIATSMSIEAKRAGVTRGMRISEIKRVSPDCIILPSDYETFGLYSTRIFEIVRRYTDDVEEYSIDECFADITGMRSVLRMNYQQILENIKHDLDVELGTICSAGLAPTKTLAKIGSKWKKPSGITIIPGKLAQYYLYHVPIGKVWGVGKSREHFLLGKGVKTALEFAYKPEEWVRRYLNKPELEIWYELRGQAVKKLMTGKVDTYHSISKGKTFTPASNNKREVFSRLCKNIENACIKVRRYGLASDLVSFGVVSQNFLPWGAEIKMDKKCAEPISFIKAIEPYFNQIFNENIFYRKTQFNLHNLTADPGQLDLFTPQAEQIRYKQLYEVADKVNERYGKHALHLGITHYAIGSGDHEGSRGELSWRKRPENWFPGETSRRKVNIPFCGEVS